jgi:hypothetical protein
MIAYRSLGPDDVTSQGQPERGPLATVGLNVSSTTSFVHSAERNGTAEIHRMLTLQRYKTRSERGQNFRFRTVPLFALYDFGHGHDGQGRVSVLCPGVE